jgi:hypothetical protein|tara:strand:- start:6027 stop:6179 length:153 start_codon:yes stop_codon:yes gene_type:complete
MPKKRKLNSKNPKYLPKDEVKEPVVKEKRLINTIKLSPKREAKVYAVFLS